jgi:hypothetical protein
MAQFHDLAWRARMTARLDVNGMMGRAGFAEKKTEMEDGRGRSRSDMSCKSDNFSCLLFDKRDFRLTSCGLNSEPYWRRKRQRSSL